MEEKIVIVDGYSFVFRAYHAMPPLSRPADGTPVGAVYGFTSMLIRLLLDMKPTHVVVVFDHGSKNHRHTLYPAYKANRPPAPEDLISQFPLVREAAEALNIPIIDQEGVEADDVIATLATLAKEHKQNVIIVSSDKDLMQLVNGHTKMYDAIRGKLMGEAEVLEKYGVTPNKIRDFLALIGDTSDNIPGLPGVGPKTAADFLNKFDTADGVFENIANIKSERHRKILQEGVETVKLSKQLVSLVHDVPLKTDFDSLKRRPLDLQKLIKFLETQGFKSLIARAKKEFVQDVEIEAVKEASDYAPKKVVKIETAAQVNDVIAKLNNVSKFALYLQDKSKISIAINEYNVFEIDLANDADQSSLFDQAGITFSFVMKKLLPIFLDNSILKIVYDYKSILHLCKPYFDAAALRGIAVNDIMQMSYALGPGRNNVAFNDLIKFYLPDLEAADLTPEASSYIMLKAHDAVAQKLLSEKAETIFHKVDRPLLAVVYEMENNGIKLDPVILQEFAKELTQQLQELSSEIYKLVGVEFNIGSPKQLSDVLFNKLGIETSKKSKSGNFSTSVEILEELQIQGHAVAELLIKWRQINKLYTTYTHTLIEHINPADGRVHSTFLLAHTNTGRFSSNNPNLQNIPVKTELGEKIRSAFVSERGYKIVSLDYSQIELRLLAHIANVKGLQKAFIEKQDIHAITASEVFGVSLKDVTPVLRRKAKAINFGIIYGISAFGLAKNLRIPRSEAGEYIKKYFTKYPEIETYMQETIKYAKQNGYVNTIMGRKCYFSMKGEGGQQNVGFLERAAINAPLQGSNSDIIRKAMVKISENILSAPKSDIRMILQVHDELLFEIHENKLEEYILPIKKIMENVVTLKVPVIVDYSVGSNWQKT